MITILVYDILRLAYITRRASETRQVSFAWIGSSSPSLQDLMYIYIYIYTHYVSYVMYSTL